MIDQANISVRYTCQVLSLVTNIKEAETWITYSPCTIIAGVNIPDFFFVFLKYDGS